MTRRPRRNHSPAFKTKVALAAIRGGKTVFDGGRKEDGKPAADVKTCMRRSAN